MRIAFQYHHAAMLLKYSGISFISGAVNHGFFSGERSLWTAAVGIVLFVAGAVMAHRLEDGSGEAEGSLLQTLLLGALLSVGLGFFTGGLQHFPDSPERSAWVVPLGFVLSVPALAMSLPVTWRPSSTAYTVVGAVVVSVASYGTWQWLERNPAYLGTHAHGPQSHDSHAHGDDDHDAAGLTALVVDRTLDIRMSDAMRFTPDRIEVRAGETLRLRVFNDGKVPHELVLGTDAEIAEHAQEMKQGKAHEPHEHAGGASIELDPGKSGELVVRFAKAMTLQMACLVPGHYEAGMRGKVEVSMASAKAATAAGHDHAGHKH